MHLNFKMYNALGSYVTKTLPILKIKNGSFRIKKKNKQTNIILQAANERQCLFEIL